MIGEPKMELVLVYTSEAFHGFSTPPVHWLPSGFVPVSYTHLDVYKRQAHINELLRSLNVNGEEEAQPVDTEQTED